MMGDVDKAMELYDAAVKYLVESNQPIETAMALSGQAHVARRGGKFEIAEGIYREVILWWEEYNQLPAVANTLECLGNIAIWREHYEHAARLFVAAAQIRKDWDAELAVKEELDDFNEDMEKLATAIGAQQRAILIAEGGQLSPHDAVLLARDPPQQDTG